MPIDCVVCFLHQRCQEHGKRCEWDLDRDDHNRASGGPAGGHEETGRAERREALLAGHLGLTADWRDKGILQHPLGFFFYTPEGRKKSARSAVTSRTIKLWMLNPRLSLHHPMLPRWNVPCWPGDIGSLHHLGLCCLNRNDLGRGNSAGDWSCSVKMLLV